MNEALSLTSRQGSQRWFLMGLLAFFVLLSAQYLVKVQFSDRDSRSAIVRWSPQLDELRDGKDIWKLGNYPNPPIMALILMPFASLPTGLGALAWFYCKIALTIVAFQWLFNLLDQPERPFPLWGKMLAVLLSLRPIQGDLTHGNVNLFILFLVMACLHAFSQRRDVWAGLALGLAIACKVTPALFVPYFVWKRAWKTLAATLVGLGLFLFLVPSLTFGWQQNWTYLQSWHQVMVQPFVVDGIVTSEHQNQSLPGVMTRLLSHAPSFTTYEGDRYVPLEFHNLAEFDRETVRWLVKGCMGLFGLLVLWRCRTPIGDRTQWKLFVEYSIVVLGMLLFSERTWKHHAVTLFLPFAVLCYALSGLPLNGRRRAFIMGALGLTAVLMLSTSTGIWDMHDWIGKTAQVYGAYALAFLVLAATLFTVLGWELAATTRSRAHQLATRDVVAESHRPDVECETLTMH